jgi:hypothetical protein
VIDRNALKSCRFLAFGILFCAAQARAAPDCPTRPGIGIGATPIFNYTTDRGLDVGTLVRRFDYRERDCTIPFRSVFTLEMSYATLGARVFEIDYEQTEVTVWNLRTSSTLALDQNNYQFYYGLGPHSEYHPELDAGNYYRFRQTDAEFTNSVRKKIPGTFIEPEAGISFDQTSYSPSQPTSKYESDFGSNKNSFFTTRFFIRNVWEHRDSEFIGSRGYYGLVGVTASPAALGNYGRAWYRWDGDYRIYAPFIANRGLWLANQIRYTGTTAGTPISEKAHLGSVGTLRGLPFDRYLANQSASFRTDLRSLWFREQIFGLPLKVGTGIFYDLGKVSDTFSGFGHEAFHHSYGFSIFGSYFTDDFLGSADFGFSEGTAAFYVRLGHPF